MRTHWTRVSGVESFITSPATPSLTASVTSASSIAAVSRMLGHESPASESCRRSPRPLVPGMRRSRTSTSGRSRVIAAIAASASGQAAITVKSGWRCSSCWSPSSTIGWSSTRISRTLKELTAYTVG